MTHPTERQARQAGLTIRKYRKTTVLSDSVTGRSVSYGTGSKRSWRQERNIDSFIRRAEKGGLA